MDNPYLAPAARLDDIDDAPIRMYSPRQIAVSGFLGGPIALLFFLTANFQALRRDTAARKTLWIGGALSLLVIFGMPFVPDSVPNTPISLGYLLVGLYVAGRYQMSKRAIADSPAHAFHSNWRVVGLGLVCLLVTVVLLIGAYFLMEAFGVDLS